MLSFRPHFVAATVMFILIGSMAVQPDENVRLLTIVPLLGAYFAFMALFTLEVDAVSGNAPPAREGDLRSEMQRAVSDLADINGVPAHERHSHLRAIEFPVQQPRLSEPGTHEPLYGRGYRAYQP